MKQIISLALVLTFSACTTPVDPLPAMEEVQMQKAEDTNCHNEPDRSDDCRHNEPNSR